jgi:DNA-binding transcriptional LysR family regulator
MEAIALTSQSHLADTDLSLSGTVRIGAPDGFGSFFLAPRIGRLTETHPNLEVQLVALPRVFSLSKREADIAIGLSRPKEKRLHGYKLTDYRLKMYAAPAYLRRHPRIDTLASQPTPVHRIRRRLALHTRARLPAASRQGRKGFAEELDPGRTA